MSEVGLHKVLKLQEKGRLCISRSLLGVLSTKMIVLLNKHRNMYTYMKRRPFTHMNDCLIDTFTKHGGGRGGEGVHFV